MSERTKTIFAYLGVVTVVILIIGILLYVISMVTNALSTAQNVLAFVGWIILHILFLALFFVALFLIFGLAFDSDRYKYVSTIAAVWFILMGMAGFVAEGILVGQNSILVSIEVNVGGIAITTLGAILIHLLSRRRALAILKDQEALSKERESQWPVWKRAIAQSLDRWFYSSPLLTSVVPEHSWEYALERYLAEEPQLDLFSDGKELRYRNQRILKDWAENWASLFTPNTELVPDEVHSRLTKLAQSIAQGLDTSVADPTSINAGIGTFSLDTRLPFQNTKLPKMLPVICMIRPPEERDIDKTLEFIRQQIGETQKVGLLLSTNDVIRELIELDIDNKMRAYAYDLVLADYESLKSILISKQPADELRRLLISHVDLNTLSPYETTGPTSAQMFFGREPEMREITDHIHDSSFVVIAGRRFGKTSILGYLHRVRLSAAGFRTLYQDCSAIPNYDAFLSTPIRAWQPDAPPDAPPTFGDLFQFSSDDKPLVLLLDEVDKLVPADSVNGWPIFNALRTLTNSRRAQVILCGERTLRDAMRDPKSPLFNFGSKMLLGPLDHPTVKELVTRPMKQLEIELVDEKAIVDRIWAFTSGHPNVVQRLCRRLIERLNEQGTRRIALDDVDAVIEDPGFQRDDFLSTYWEAATSLEKIISLLMADDENVRTLRTVRRALTERCNLRPKAREVDEALQRLVDLRSILKRTPTGYEFAVTAFPRVVAGTMTLDDMLEILTEEYQEQEE